MVGRLFVPPDALVTPSGKADAVREKPTFKLHVAHMYYIYCLPDLGSNTVTINDD